MSLSYDEALHYLYSLISYEARQPERYNSQTISLERPRALMAKLGNPQDTYPTFHITGTKGKGSVSAFCASALKAAGLRVGFFSSPHLQDFRERFRVNDELISPEQLAALVERIQPFVQEEPGLTWFEVITAIAFLYFADANVDVAVLEVGLGGRLDATNIIRAPLVSVITSISYDHMNWLGSTLDKIAYEKAGIIKPHVPVVSAPQPAEALPVIERVAQNHDAPLTVVGRDYTFEMRSRNEYGQEVVIAKNGDIPQSYWIPLLGQHQAINAAVALAALHHARADKKIGSALTDSAFHTGFAQVNWPGRLEVISRSPWLVLDAAHNDASAAQLAHALQTLFQFKKLLLIFGASADKNIAAMFRELLPITSHLILTQASNTRALNTEQLAAIARSTDYHGPVETIHSTQEALSRAEALAEAQDMICVTGSVFIVGEMRTHLNLTPGRARYLDEAIVQEQRSGRY